MTRYDYVIYDLKKKIADEPEKVLERSQVEAESISDAYGRLHEKAEQSYPGVQRYIEVMQQQDVA